MLAPCFHDNMTSLGSRQKARGVTAFTNILNIGLDAEL